MRLIGKWVFIPALFLAVTSVSVFAKDTHKSCEAVDTDKDGKLSADEVAAAAAKRATCRIEEFMKKHDVNKDGSITKDEVKPQRVEKMGLAAADTDTDGKWTKEEITAFFQKKVSEKSAAAFKARDANSDGFITVEDIKKDSAKTEVLDPLKKENLDALKQEGLDALKKQGIDAIMGEIDSLFSN